jgi:flavodoxin
MDIKKIGKIFGIGIILVIIAAFAAVGFIFYDIMSYTATGSQTLNPSGTAIGKALVIYDPGVTGAAKTVAGTIASDLQTKGYTVELAGIRSAAAANTIGYKVIVVGGPIYAGNASSSVKEYLKTLNPALGTEIGVFSTGQDPDTAKDPALLQNEAAPLPVNSTLQIKAVMKIVSQENYKQKITDFVNLLVQ